MANQLALRGIQKAAALLIALGPEVSAQILKHFRETDIERLTLEIFRMDKVPDEAREKVLEEFFHMSVTQQYLSIGGAGYARELLEKAVGKDRAEELIERITNLRRPMPFDFVRKTDPASVVSFLQNEHPQTIALVLAHLPQATASAVLGALDHDLQADVVLRMATMDRTSPDIIREVEKVLQDKMSVLIADEYATVGGVEQVAKLLSRVDRATEKAILMRLEERDPELAEQVRKLLFTFDDLVKLDDRSLQRVLREVDSKDLALALKGASEDLKEKVFRNMSSRAAEMLKEEIALSGPVRLKSVEEAQQRIVNVVRRLDEAEEIVISRGEEDVIV
jgi:flagellar motor switch protein FliG